MRARVLALGEEIGAAYAHAPRAPLAVGILKGCTLFLADLLRAIPLEMSVDFMSISPFAHGGAHPGTVRILKDLERDIGGLDVLIVEDIVDTGLTLAYLRRTLGGRGPRSLATVTLLDKRARRIVPVPIEHLGFATPDTFVVGYGLDWRGLYRNLEDLVAVRDFAALEGDPHLLGRLGTRALGGRGVSLQP